MTECSPVVLAFAYRCRNRILQLAAAAALSVTADAQTVRPTQWVPEADYVPFTFDLLPEIALTQDGRLALWNVATDFTTSANPNGEWSYGYSLNRFGAFNLATNAGFPLDLISLGWFSIAVGLQPCTIRAGNFTSFPLLGQGVTLPAGAVGMQPDSLGKFAVVRWTAPEDGQYVIDVQFTGRSTAEVGNTDVAVLRDGLQLFFTQLRDPRQISILKTTFDLVTGETLEFRVGKSNDSNLNDLKQLDVVIQRVPRICVGDINGDGFVNTLDLTALLGQFGTDVPPSEGGDINGDGTVNSQDLTALIQNLGCSR